MPDLPLSTRTAWKLCRTCTRIQELRESYAGLALEYKELRESYAGLALEYKNCVKAMQDLLSHLSARTAWKLCRTCTSVQERRERYTCRVCMWLGTALLSIVRFSMWLQELRESYDGLALEYKNCVKVMPDLHSNLRTAWKLCRTCSWVQELRESYAGLALEFKNYVKAMPDLHLGNKELSESCNY